MKNDFYCSIKIRPTSIWHNLFGGRVRRKWPQFLINCESFHNLVNRNLSDHHVLQISFGGLYLKRLIFRGEDSVFCHF